jgi:hypothetical protein
MADSSVVGLHSLKPGRKTIWLPGEFAVRDLTTGRRSARKTNRLSFMLTRPDTRVFRIEPIRPLPRKAVGSARSQ